MNSDESRKKLSSQPKARPSTNKATSKNSPSPAKKKSTQAQPQKKTAQNKAANAKASGTRTQPKKSTAPRKPGNKKPSNAQPAVRSTGSTPAATNDSHNPLAFLPLWGWILAVGAVLAVLAALIALFMMKNLDSEDYSGSGSPTSVITPTYPPATTLPGSDSTEDADGDGYPDSWGNDIHNRN